MYQEKQHNSQTQAKKPRFHADAALLIDIWGADVPWMAFYDNRRFSIDQWQNYMSKFIKNCTLDLQQFDFDVLLSATYRNEDHPAFNKNLADSLDQLREFTPMHYAKYKCGPIKKFFLDCQMADIYKFVKPRGKIIVGGGSWGACVHFRPVGMYKLIREGFRVFTTPTICYNMPDHHATGETMVGIHLQDLLWDDVVWTRCVDKGIYYDNLYEGIMVHPDNALNRKNVYGVDLNKT